MLFEVLFDGTGEQYKGAMGIDELLISCRWFSQEVNVTEKKKEGSEQKWGREERQWNEYIEFIVNQGDRCTYLQKKQYRFRCIQQPNNSIVRSSYSIPYFLRPSNPTYVLLSCYSDLMC